MKLFIIGHRGVGKTALAARLAGYLENKIPLFDLDQEVRNEEGRDAFQIFREEGEDYFRRRELEVFHRLNGEHEELILVLGAGFKLDRAFLPRGARVLWVLRDTDPAGRIFTDRPRLEPGKDPLEEYRLRFEARELLYKLHATEFYLMPEGVLRANEVERGLLLGTATKQGGILTLTPKMLERWDQLVGSFPRWGFDFVEVRDDLLADEQIDTALALVPREKMLLSFRRAESNPVFLDLAHQGYAFDWPAEKEPLRFQTTGLAIHSSHGERPPAEEPFFNHFKWSPPVDTWDQLEAGLRWQASAPDKRSYLPRSTDGRWRWVRQLLKGRQKLNFLRLNREGVADQPSFYQWAATPPASAAFAAIIGSPVGASRTPVEQQEFFLDRGMPVLAIDFTAAEAARVFPLLEQLGGRAFAVTAPLKHWAGARSSARTAVAEELQSINSMAFRDQVWHGTNTDLDGFRRLMEEVSDPGAVAVWGGGGTLAVIQKILPHADFYSVRTGQSRTHATGATEPETVIWAAGPDAEDPPDSWAPLRVVDLNYREDSRARAYAVARRAHYISGAVMFEGQAEAQREFWKGLL